MNFSIKHLLSGTTGKKILFLTGFILIVFVLGYLLYAVFFRPVPPAEITETEPETGIGPTGLPEAETGPGQVITPAEEEKLPAAPTSEITASPRAEGGLTQTTTLNETPASGTVLSADGSGLQYYDSQTGKFYKINADGKITALTDKIFYQAQSITWSPNKNKAILEYPDGANIIYDFANGEQITLPAHWEDFSFSPDGNQIAMKSLGLDVDNRYLAVASDDGSQARTIEPLGENEASVYTAWSPNNQIIAVHTAGVDLDRQEVFFIGLNGENFKSTVVEGRGFAYQWSPAGDRILYSVYSSDNDLKPLLWTVNAQGESIGSDRQSLGLETWTDKCVFASNETAYCAVPESLPEGAGLFPELADEYPDRLYEVNVRTGLKKLIAIPDNDYNMTNLIVSANGYYLYFTDKTTGLIHQIRLK